MSVSRPWRPRLVLAAALLVIVSACGHSPEQLYESAVEEAKAGDPSAAVRDLKEALQKKPEFAAARRLLGEQYLRLGNAPDAIKELQRAIELGEPEKQVLPLILRAELDNLEPTKALDRLNKIPADELNARLWSLRGEALLDTKDPNGAKAAFSNALRLDAREADAHLGLARVAWASGDGAGADRAFAQAVRLAPQSVRAWLARGDFELSQRQFDKALVSFERARKAGAGFDRVRAELGLARTYLFKGDLKNAEKYADLLLKHAPDLPLAHYVAALVAHQKGQWRRAEEQLEIVLSKIPDHVPSIFLKGVVAAAQQKWLVAEQDLSRVVTLAPNDLQSRKLLATVYLREGQIDKAIATLEAAEALGVADPQFLAMLGGAYMRAGQQQKGLAAMEKAASMAPNRPEFRTQVALGHLAMGESEAATNELRSAANLSSSDMRSDVLLVMVLLRDKKFDEALAQTQRLIKENPRDPMRYNLQAAAYLGKNDEVRANQSLQQALKIDPNFGPAKMNLALIAQRKGDNDGAYRIYQDVWKGDKTNYRALASIVQIDFARGRGAQAILMLEKIRIDQPQAIEPRSMLLTYFNQVRDFSKAIAVAKELVDIQPRSPITRLAYAQALISTQRFGEAVDVLDPLGRDAPNSPEVQYELARAKLATNGRLDARQALTRALELSKGAFEPAVVLKAVVDIQDGRFADARTGIALLRQKRGDAPSVHLLEGDLAAGEQRWPDAIASYRKAIAAAPSTESLGKLSNALVRSGKAAEARNELANWLRRYPNDVSARMQLADVQMTMGAMAEAQAGYEAVVRASPNNAFALNNLAWLYLQRGDRRAVTVADKALRLMPDNPEIMDTAAWVHFKTGQRDGVVGQLRKAADRSANPEIRYHIAEVLASTGDRAGARAELDRILAPGAPAFGSRAEAQRLRARL